MTRHLSANRRPPTFLQSRLHYQIKHCLVSTSRIKIAAFQIACKGTHITGLDLSGVLPMRKANHLRIEFGVLLWHILKHAHIS